MSATLDLITNAIYEEEGNSGDDPSNINRWLGCFKKGSKLVWDSRSYLFKQVTNEAFVFDPAANVLLPADFGNFQTMGAGIYYQTPKYQILPAYANQMAKAKYGQMFQGSALPQWFSIRPDQSVPATGRSELQLFPQPPDVRTLTLIYLRRDPILTTDDMTDEIAWIPAQWHSVIDSGARWWNQVKSGGSAKDEYKGLFEKAVQEMADSERWGGPGLDMISKWRPNRLTSVQ